jgi:hypothetical protein
MEAIMEIIDLGHVDLDEQIPDDAKQVLTVYQEQNHIHMVATPKFDVKYWGELFAHLAWSLSAVFNNQPTAFAAICDAFNNEARQLRKISKN